MPILLTLSLLVFARPASADPLTLLGRLHVKAAIKIFAPRATEVEIERILTDVSELEVGAIASTPERAMNLLASRVAAGLKEVLADSRAHREPDPARMQAILRDLIVAHRIATHREWSQPERVLGTNSILSLGSIIGLWIFIFAGRDGSVLFHDIPAGLIFANVVYTVSRWTKQYDWLPTLPGVDVVLDFHQTGKTLPEFYKKLAMLLSDELGRTRQVKDRGARGVMRDIDLVLRTVWPPHQVDEACVRLLAER